MISTGDRDLKDDSDDNDGRISQRGRCVGLRAERDWKCDDEWSSRRQRGGWGDCGRFIIQVETLGTRNKCRQ